METVKKVENLAVNTIRCLSMDMINRANSGHPGVCLGAAPMMYTLYKNHMNATPSDSKWYNRDRFVMAAGHGSALLYSNLHLTGYNISIDDMKNFRQLNSATPGHPEYGHTDGVDATSGPLGQGIPMGVGSALAEKYLADKFNRDGYDIVNHFTYVLCGDGDLMEGVTLEALSLAGHLKLGKLVVLYDSNDITLDGKLSDSFSENTKEKFEAMGWHVVKVADGNDVEAIDKAIADAKEVTDKPSLIEVKTIIGYGSSKQGTSGVHGSPLGVDETLKLRKIYKYDHNDFDVNEEVYNHYKETFVKRGDNALSEWQNTLNSYKNEFPDMYKMFIEAVENNLVVDISNDFKNIKLGEKIATREASERAINAIANLVPTFIGGAADLSSSNKTKIKDGGFFSPITPQGRNINFGIREHAMAAVANGMALHGGIKVFVATFFVFSDYLKPAVRMAALMNLPVTYVFTHDSIAVGEDGPTHQPIEQLPMFRSMPNLCVIRPSDAVETAKAWEIACNSKDKPTALVLSRQGIETLTSLESAKTNMGAYIVRDVLTPDGILIATGSEVPIAVRAAEELSKKGKNVRVVNIPSWDLFEMQSAEYKESILPKSITKRLTIEMASKLGWERYSLSQEAIIGMDSFGASGKAEEVVEYFGFTADNVVNKYLNL